MQTHPSYNITHTIHRFQNNTWSTISDTVVSEKSVTILVNGNPYAQLVCSPWDLKDLAIGFLCSKGQLKKAEDLKMLSIDEETDSVCVEIEESENNASTDSQTTGKLPISTQVCLAPETILELSSRLEEHSELFRQTGGVHCAAIADQQDFCFFAEDIGRYNTLDRLYGYCFQNQIPLHDKILVFSGRISSEILLKTAKMGCPVLLSRSAPTDLAVTLAENLGITLVGFARNNRFNVYTHPERII